MLICICHILHKRCWDSPVAAYPQGLGISSKQMLHSCKHHNLSSKQCCVTHVTYSAAMMGNASRSNTLTLTAKYLVCRITVTHITVNAGHCITMCSWTLAVVQINPSYAWQVCSCKRGPTFSQALVLIVSAFDRLGHCKPLAGLLCSSTGALALALQHCWCALQTVF